VFTTDRGLSATEKVLILQGERNRRLAVTLPGKHHEEAEAKDEAEAAEADPSHDETTDEPSPKRAHRPSRAPTEPPAEAAHSEGVPALSWVLGGVGLLAGGGYVLFSTWGRKDDQILQQRCAPTCQQSSVDHVEQRYLVADISLGVGVAALGSALLVYALRGSTEESHGQQAYAVEVHPTATGALASVTGSF
jgi:hypothetical protein